MGRYGDRERRRLDRIEEALGRSPRERKGQSSRETRTREELLNMESLSDKPYVEYEAKAVPPSDWEWDDQRKEEPSQYDYEYDEYDFERTTPCIERFPDVFSTVSLGFSFTGREGPGKSTRIDSYKFVSDKPCTDATDRSEITGYLYVQWFNNMKVGRYGPMSIADFDTFRNSKSPGSSFIKPGYSAPYREIDLYAKGYKDMGDEPMPGDREHDDNEQP